MLNESFKICSVNWQCFARHLSQCLILADPVSLPQMSKDSTQSVVSPRSLTCRHRGGPSLPVPAFLQVQSSWRSLPVALGAPCTGSLGSAFWVPGVRVGPASGGGSCVLQVTTAEHAVHLPPATRPLVIANQWVEVTVSRPFFPPPCTDSSNPE